MTKRLDERLIYRLPRKAEGQKLTYRDISSETKRVKETRGRVIEVNEKENEIFTKAVYKILKDQFTEIKKVTYWFKYDLINGNMRFIMDELEEMGYNDLIDKIILNKRAYITTCLIHAKELYKKLDSKQKLVVLTHAYRIYSGPHEEYLSPEIFIKALDEGKIGDYYVNRTSYIDYVESFLENKVNQSDILFYLQNEWMKETGDYFYKWGEVSISRQSKLFTKKHYIAFNKVFRYVFGRDIKCLNDLKDDSSEGLINRMKGIIDAKENSN